MTASNAPRVTSWDPELGFRFTTPAPGCDFCGVALQGSWSRFGCDDFTRTVPGFPTFGIRMIGYWAACRPCAPYVRARTWRALIDHVTTVRVAAGIPDAGHPEVRSELAALYLELERHLSGVERQAGECG